MQNCKDHICRNLNKDVIFLHEVAHFGVRFGIAKERHSGYVFRIVIVCMCVNVYLKVETDRIFLSLLHSVSV